MSLNLLLTPFCFTHYVKFFNGKQWNKSLTCFILSPPNSFCYQLLAIYIFVITDKNCKLKFYCTFVFSSFMYSLCIFVLGKNKLTYLSQAHKSASIFSSFAKHLNVPFPENNIPFFHVFSFFHLERKLTLWVRGSRE